MQISPIPQPGQDSSLQVTTRAPVALQLGEIVEAEVLNVTETVAAIRMKGTILEAQTNVQLKEGDTIRLRVEGWENQVRLRLVPAGQEDAASVRNLLLNALARLPAGRPAAGDLAVLSLVLRGLPAVVRAAAPELAGLERLLVSMEQMSASSLKSGIDGSGAFLETKLRFQVLQAGRGGTEAPQETAPMLRQDLKAALLAAGEALGRPELRDRLSQAGVRPEQMAATVDNLVRNIETLQVQSKLTETLQVLVPFVWQDLREGELVFRGSEGGARGEERAFSCTVTLDLERAGKVSAGLLLQGGTVHATFAGENARFLRLIEEHLEPLRAQLEAAGVRPGLLSVRPAGADVQSVGPGGLDITI